MRIFVLRNVYICPQKCVYLTSEMCIFDLRNAYICPQKCVYSSSEMFT